MTVPRPDHHDRIDDLWSTEEASMDTFTMRWPRSPIVAILGRNPLIRNSDRVESVVIVLAVVVSLLAAPIAAAIGTAIHDSRRHLYAEQSDTRHPAGIWVDSNGSAADASLPTTTRAAVEAVTVAVGIWLGVVVLAAAAYAGTRITVERIREAGWQNDLDGDWSRDD